MPADLDDRVLETTADLFGMQAAPTRLRIVCALVEVEERVSELLEQVGVSQSNMSQHLGTPYRDRLLARRRTGAHIFYPIENEQVQRFCLAPKRQQDGAMTEMAAAGSSR